MFRSVAALGFAALALGGCTTTGSLPPTEVIRYHLGPQTITRGTVAVEPVTGPGVPTPPEFPAYAAAVQGQLARVGYTPTPAGAQPDFLAIVDLRRTTRPGPPRRSPISIGLGGGSYSGGYHGGVGLGGGVSFPLGGGRRRELAFTELGVTVKHRTDQTAVWDGQARGVTDASGPQASVEAQAGRLAQALFTGFPGESGRSIEVK